MSDTVNGTIKPLEWTQPYPNEETAYAETILGSWTVWEMSDGSAYCRGPSDKSGRPVGNGLEAAKAAAQADYEQRIRSCIATPANATDTAGLDPKDNDAIWAAFYRDGLNLDQIAKRFGLGIYDLSPWLYKPLMRKEEPDALSALRAENERVKAERDRQYDENVHRIVEQTKAEAERDRLQAELARMRDRLTSPEFLRPLIQEQSAGEWDDKTIDADVETFAAAIRAALTDSQKETGA